MKYCDLPNEINNEASLKEALETLIENHGVYKICYEKQKGLIDAVRRRTEN